MSFYTALTGLNAATAQLGVTANNIANVGTAGFKRSRADFGDIFATSPLQQASSVVGQGVSLKKVSQEFSQGNIQVSSNALDLAITGDGFFALGTPDGAKVFTREILLSRVWGYDYYGGARTVDVHIRRLRAKLGEEQANLIQTVRSVGYRFGQSRWGN